MNTQSCFTNIPLILSQFFKTVPSFLLLTGQCDVYNGVTVCIIGDLIVITAMYFEPYSKPRNIPNSHLHPPSSLPLQETTSKFTMLRPPPQNNPLAPKPPYADLRSDNNKHNTSAHVFLSAAKPSTLPQRVTSNYPVRPEPTLPLPFSRHTLPEEQKYICHSPGKPGSRISAGMVFEEIPQNRYDYRRSESIAEMKPLGEPFRDSSINYYNPHQRLPPNDPQDPRSAVPNANTTLQLMFNPQQDRSRLSRKESIEGPLLTNRQERAEPPQVKQPYTQKKILKEGYSDLFQNKPTIPAFDPQKYEYLTARAEIADPLKKYDFQSRRFEPEAKRSDAFKTFEEIYKNSLQSVLENSELRREGSQDLLRKYSVSKLPPDLDKSLDQDIETLRYASKKTDEVIDREMHKNAYLNQLFQQKGLRGPSEDKPIENTKEKKEVAARHIVFERELEEKNRELTDKGRLLSEKQKELQEKKKEIMLKNQQITQKDKVLAQKDRLLLEKEVLLREKTKELIEKGKIVAEKDRIIAELGTDKERIIDGLQADVRRLQDELTKKQDSWKQREIALQEQLSTLNTNLTLSLAINAELQAKLRQKEEKSLVKMQDTSTLQKTSQQQKEKIQRLQSQLANASHTIIQQETTINTLQSTINSCQVRANEQNAAFELLKQKCESEKLSLINLYKKEMTDLRARLDVDNEIRPKGEGNAYLQAEIVQLQQRNSLIEQELSSLSKQHKKIVQEYDLLQEQYSEVVSLLLLPKQSPHEALLGRLRECLQVYARSEGMQAKQLQRVQDYQLQRLQQEHLQRRHQELSRELKKVGSRLAGASMQAQQGSRLLRQANNQILLMNLMNLNEKYRFLLENQ